MIALVFCVALFATDEAQQPYHRQCIEIHAESRMSFVKAMLASIPFGHSYEVTRNPKGPDNLTLEVVP